MSDEKKYETHLMSEDMRSPLYVFETYVKGACARLESDDGSIAEIGFTPWGRVARLVSSDRLKITYRWL